MIEGTLVRLRAPSLDDAERGHRWINDEETAKLLNGTYYPRSRDNQAEWTRTRASKMPSFTRAPFAIDTIEGNVHIGNCDIFDASPEDRWGWLGILIGEPDYRSRGYGADAIRTLLTFAFDDMNLEAVRLQVWSFNPRAIACYRKCGFVEEARLRQDLYVSGAYHDTIVMAITRGEHAEAMAQAQKEASR